MVHNKLHYILQRVSVYVGAIFREPHIYCSISGTTAFVQTCWYKAVFSLML